MLINQSIQSMKTCPRCGSKKFWSLSTGQIWCSNCGLTRKSSKNLWQSTRISLYWKGKLVDYFSLGVPAYRLRFQVPYSKPTMLRWVRTLREIIYQDSIQELKPLSGEIEIDETMFGVRRAVKRGWGAAGKNIFFCIYQRNGKVLLFPSLLRPKRPCGSISNDILNQEAFATLTIGLPMPSCLSGKSCDHIKRERCIENPESYNGIESF